MAEHLYHDFLHNSSSYDRATEYWVRIWHRTDPVVRHQNGWTYPWFPSDPFRDGDPIFSAISREQRKAIRVIQYEPSASAPAFQYWIDTFGGKPSDPGAISELVLACTLTHDSAMRVLDYMEQWLHGPIAVTFPPEPVTILETGQPYFLTPLTSGSIA